MGSAMAPASLQPTGRIRGSTTERAPQPMPHFRASAIDIPCTILARIIHAFARGLYRRNIRRPYSICAHPGRKYIVPLDEFHPGIALFFSMTLVAIRGRNRERIAPRSAGAPVVSLPYSISAAGRSHP